MSPTSQELLLAYRWPAAVVVSSVVLAATAIQILSKPIPIRIEGGLQVDKLVLPASVTIRSNEPLPVAVREDVVITGTTPWRFKAKFRWVEKCRPMFDPSRRLFK